MSNPFAWPELTSRLADSLAWLQSTHGAKNASVKLDRLEFLYVLSCVRFYESEMAMRAAEKLPLAGLPPIKMVDTLPSETETQ